MATWTWISCSTVTHWQNKLELQCDGANGLFLQVRLDGCARFTFATCVRHMTVDKWKRKSFWTFGDMTSFCSHVVRYVCWQLMLFCVMFVPECHERPVNGPAERITMWLDMTSVPENMSSTCFILKMLFSRYVTYWTLSHLTFASHSAAAAIRNLYHSNITWFPTYSVWLWCSFASLHRALTIKSPPSTRLDCFFLDILTESDTERLFLHKSPKWK